MGVSLEHAEKEVATFNAYFDTLIPQEQSDFYGGRRSTIRNYQHCNFCGGSYRNMRPFRPGDCPDGVTIGPIIDCTTDNGESNA